MKLKYRRKENGLYILNRPVDIDDFAENKLYLTVLNKSLDYGQAILGLTAFADVKDIPCLDDMLRPTTINLDAGNVLIHSWLNNRINMNRRRFTVAHECAHWILHRSFHSPTNQKYSFRAEQSAYIACRSTNIERKYHKRTTDEDWEEWQADTLAAALLMPLEPFCNLANRRISNDKKHLSTVVNREYIEIVEELADVFQVSKTAAEIRLKQLGYIKKPPRITT